VGAFLGDSAGRPKHHVSMEEQKQLWTAKQNYTKCIRLHGILQALKDFTDAILGVRLEIEPSTDKGWNKNVQLIHVYKKKDDGREATDDDNDDGDLFLGTIYMDPFADAYWRTDDAKELVTTRLFSRSSYQTPAPIAMMSLRIKPTWDDEPNPMTLDDTRDVLYQFGKALQLILQQQQLLGRITVEKPPIDTSELLAHVSTAGVQVL
jgi:Zn-dependent oligopeptidase